MKITVCRAAVLAACCGCAVFSPEERARWEKGRALQNEGRHEQALAEFVHVLQAHTGKSPVETAELRMDAARSHIALDQFDAADELLAPLSAGSALRDKQRARYLTVSGWSPVRRVQRQAQADRPALLETARRSFRRLQAIAPDTYEGRLGHGMALYETARLHDSHTHLAHALDLFAACATENPNDPALLFARARAMQRYMGATTPEALHMLARAFELDRNLDELAVYVELFEEIAPYPNAKALQAAVADPARRALLNTYAGLLGQAAARPTAGGPFWRQVRDHTTKFENWTLREARFTQTVQDARNALLSPDASPLIAAQNAFQTIQEAARFAGGEKELLESASYKEARTEILESLFLALERRIQHATESENIHVAEDHLAEAFTHIKSERHEAQVNWARRFQEHRETLACRVEFIEGRARLRRELAQRSPDDIRRELKQLGERFRACTVERDLNELGQELLAEQSLVFQQTIAAAHKAAQDRDFDQERRLLAKALELTALKEFAHRADELRLACARSYAQDGLWQQARLEVEQIDSSRRSAEAWLLLGTAHAKAEAFREAAQIFSRRELSDELALDPRWACAAGLSFAHRGDARRAAALLGPPASTTGIELPFAREQIVAAVVAALLTLLEGDATGDERALAETLVNAGAGGGALANALGLNFLAARQWDKALALLLKARQWGTEVSTDLVQRLEACVHDYAPLSEGRRWEYRQGDGKLLTVTVDRDLGNGRYAVGFRVGDAHTPWQWEKRDGGRLLCEFFGANFRRSHVYPVGLADPTPGAPLPSVEYTIGDAVWTARITALGQRVATEAGVFENCLCVETTPPGGAGTLRRYFAPGVGWVRVEYAGQDQAALTLVKTSAGPGNTAQAPSPGE